jgi:hypothetical protein
LQNRMAMSRPQANTRLHHPPRQATCCRYDRR